MEAAADIRRLRSGIIGLEEMCMASAIPGAERLVIGLAFGRKGLFINLEQAVDRGGPNKGLLCARSPGRAHLREDGILHFCNSGSFANARVEWKARCRNTCWVCSKGPSGDDRHRPLTEGNLIRHEDRSCRPLGGRQGRYPS